jgi:hypothetical protein
MKVVVYHSMYGCDTGCCGHVVELQEDDGEAVKEAFEFDHPYGLYKVKPEDRDRVAREYAEELVLGARHRRLTMRTARLVQPPVDERNTE